MPEVEIKPEGIRLSGVIIDDMDEWTHNYLIGHASEMVRRQQTRGKIRGLLRSKTKRGPKRRANADSRRG